MCNCHPRTVPLSAPFFTVYLASICRNNHQYNRLTYITANAMYGLVIIMHIAFAFEWKTKMAIWLSNWEDLTEINNCIQHNRNGRRTHIHDVCPLASRTVPRVACALQCILFLLFVRRMLLSVVQVDNNRTKPINYLISNSRFIEWQTLTTWIDFYPIYTCFVCLSLALYAKLAIVMAM